MARAGRRYSLAIYTYMMDRWWPATLFLALGLLALAWAVQRSEQMLSAMLTSFPARW